MAKPRKMLGRADAPYIVSLMRLIETQSKPTIVDWCLDYSEQNLLPIYAHYYPNDARPQAALAAARQWMAKQIKLPAARQMILAAHAAAREAEAYPAAQAAARAMAQAASSIHMPTHALGIAFYGAAAVAYEQLGLTATPEVYDSIAAAECARMQAALAAVAVADEPQPAKINWNC